MYSVQRSCAALLDRGGVVHPDGARHQASAPAGNAQLVVGRLRGTRRSSRAAADVPGRGPGAWQADRLDARALGRRATAPAPRSWRPDGSTTFGRPRLVTRVGDGTTTLRSVPSTGRGRSRVRADGDDGRSWRRRRRSPRRWRPPSPIRARRCGASAGEPPARAGRRRCGGRLSRVGRVVVAVSGDQCSPCRGHGWQPGVTVDAVRPTAPVTRLRRGPGPPVVEVRTR